MHDLPEFKTLRKADTSADMQREYDARLRALTPQERFLRGLSLTHLAREMCLAGILAQNPNLSPSEAKLRFFEKLYGDEFLEPDAVKQRLAERR